MNTAYDFAFSAQGYNHIKSGKVCQDSSGHYSDESMAVIVVADGHGSDNYPRSDRGSRFAVEAAITAIREFVKTVEKSAIDISIDSYSYLEQLAKNILANWYTAVEADWEKYPFSEEGLTKVSEKYKKAYMSRQRREKAYGTTLIAVCQTRHYWFGLQIGDGKCVCISQDGSVYEPIPWDEACEANITTSICDTDAIDKFRYCFMKECPAATLMGSDGIDDTYAGSEELYVLYRSILAIFAEYGRETGETEVQEYLPTLSRNGSGDDVSIAGIVSATLSTAFVEMVKAQSEYANAKAQKELAEREVDAAEKKQEYFLAALKKAKKNYEQCEQKATEAKDAIVAAQRTQEDAIKRFASAEIALSAAVTAYQSSITSENPCAVRIVDGETEKESAVPESAAQEVESEDFAVNRPASAERNEVEIPEECAKAPNADENNEPQPEGTVEDTNHSGQ